MIVTLIILGVLILIHELGHFCVAKLRGIKVEVFSMGFGPSLIKLNKGDTSYCLKVIPFGGYVKLAGDEPGTVTGKSWEFYSRGFMDRIAVVLGGPFANYLFAYLLFSLIFFVGEPKYIPVIGTVMAEYPAAEAGMLEGDKVLKVNGVPTVYWDEVTHEIRNTNSDTIAVEVMREGQPLTLNIIPKKEKIRTILGSEKTIPIIGIYHNGEVVNVRHDFADSFMKGGQRLFELTSLTYRSLFAVLTGAVSAKESFTGPIGIFVIANDASRMGIIYILQLTALITMSLAIVNLLPIPILDGGHVLFFILEAFRGKPFKPRTYEVTTAIGMTFIISLAIFISFNDISKFGVLDKLINWWSAK